MGDPKKPKKKYETPRFPWRSDILQNELVLLGQYGLRNKRELWRAKTMLSRFRGIARSLLSMPADKRVKLESGLLGKLKRLGILPEHAVLDDVLDMTIENILDRRLQTIVLRKGLARTPYQARQLITHGHIAVNNKVVYSPSYLVSREEEESVTYAFASPLNNPEHPLRLSIEIAPRTSGGEQ
ncbi:MAG: 30S ribosomal protein S4 [Candidatus Bathyarchaeia archaeon]|nr:30S ribosomal protein S4 [Candidatus Bathyarchaeota archaeon]